MTDRIRRMMAPLLCAFLTLGACEKERSAAPSLAETSTHIDEAPLPTPVEELRPEVAAPPVAPAPEPAAPSLPAPADVALSLDATCAEIGRVTDASFAKVEELRRLAAVASDAIDVIPRANVGTCVRAPGGAFAIEITDSSYEYKEFQFGPDGPPERLGATGMTSQLVFVDPHGNRTSLPLRVETLCGAPGDFYADIDFGNWWHLKAVHDWNGDGVPEVALTRLSRQGSDSEETIDFFRLSPNQPAPSYALERWEPVEYGRVRKISDDDGDGHLDLFTYGPFAYATPDSDTLIQPSDLYYFHHAKPDGTFESAGAAAEAYYRRACGRKKVTVRDIALDPPDGVTSDMARANALLKKVICARLYGASRAAVLKRANALTRTAFGDGFGSDDEAWLAELPVRLAK